MAYTQYWCNKIFLGSIVVLKSEIVIMTFYETCISVHYWVKLATGILSNPVRNFVVLTINRILGRAKVRSRNALGFVTLKAPPIQSCFQQLQILGSVICLSPQTHQLPDMHRRCSAIQRGCHHPIQINASGQGQVMEFNGLLLAR